MGGLKAEHALYCQNKGKNKFQTSSKPPKYDKLLHNSSNSRLSVTFLQEKMHNSPPENVQYLTDKFIPF